MRSTILFSAVSDVSVRFPEYIAEIREFLAQSGLPVGTPEALPALLESLGTSPAFREDLTSMLRVVCASEPGVSYLELLGLLMAASGQHSPSLGLEPSTGEDTARGLFNAVVDMRRSITLPAQEPEPDSAEADASEPLPVEAPLDTTPALLDRVAAGAAPAASIPAPRPAATPPIASPTTSPHERLARALAFAADQDHFGSAVEPPLGHFGNAITPPQEQPEVHPYAAVDLPDTYPAPIPAAIPAPVPQPASTSRATVPAVAPVAPLAGSDSLFLASVPPAPTSRHGQTWAAAACALALGVLLGILYERHVTTSPAASTPASTAASGQTSAPATRPVAATHSPYGLRHALPRPLPAPASAAATYTPSSTPARGNNVMDSAPPVRTATAVASPKPHAGIASIPPSPSRPLPAPSPASVSPARLSTADAAARDTRLITGRGPGRVTLGSAGIMAANLVSSPAPLYPAQASAAQVEGEVIIEAIVGRDGGVVDTRVISGPPLLREAARSAVERWRYRPYEVDGAPAEIATTARVDFRLNAE